MKWAFSYIYKAEKESTDASLPFGVAFHAAASLFAINKQNDKTLSEKEVQDAFGEWLKLELSTAQNLRLDNGESFDSLNELGRKMLSILLTGLASTQRVLSVSKAFKVPILGASGEPVSELPLVGELDLEILDGSERVVVDWKTSARKWPADKAGKDLQPTCFLYAKLLQNCYKHLNNKSKIATMALWRSRVHPSYAPPFFCTRSPPSSLA